MADINMTFDEEWTRISAEIIQKVSEEKKRLAKFEDIYDELFGELSLTDKLAKYIKIKPWTTMINDYFKANKELLNDLNFTDVIDFNLHIDDCFIEELKANFTFIELDFDKLDLSDEDINLWEESTVFWFTTGLWLVTINDTDYIVHEMSGHGKTLYFIDTVDEFIVSDPNAKANLSDDDLNKFAEQFKEFALKCKN